MKHNQCSLCHRTIPDFVSRKSKNDELPADSINEALPHSYAANRYDRICDLLNAVAPFLDQNHTLIRDQDFLGGVRTLCFHRNINGIYPDLTRKGIESTFKVAFKVNTATGRTKEFRLGASLAAALVTDEDIVDFLDTHRRDEPWSYHPADWARYVEMIIRIADRFLSINTAQNTFYDLSGLFLENIDLNRSLKTV